MTLAAKALTALVSAALASLLLPAQPGQARAVPGRTRPAVAAAGWSATWGTAQAQAIPVSGWQNQTLRFADRTSIGGTSVRIHLANTFATSTAVFSHVSIGIQQNGAWTQAPPVPVTFGGSSSVTLSPGAGAVSDSVPLAVSANTRVLVSLYIPSGANITSAPAHQLPANQEYNIVGSDATSVQKPAVTNMFNFTSYLSGIDVNTSANSAVVAVGDSITDGTGATVDADNRWPDFLADRLSSAGLSVVNKGIVADWVIADQPGNQSVTNRFSRDVLSVTGIRTVIDEGGINDLRGGVSATVLETAQKNLITLAHNAGLRIILTTLTPCQGDSLCTSSFENQREAYNNWVFGGFSGADGVADFNGAVMNPSNAFALNPAYDSGDHIHPNPAGYAVLANCIDLSIL